MEFLDKVMAFLVSTEGSIATIAIIMEFGFRLIKTDKPRSILLLIASGAEKTGKALVKVAELLNKIIPQRLK
jgi:hypothetical protein